MFTFPKDDFRDIESGPVLYPGIPAEYNALRWGFIRKVYGILCTQVILTIIVAALVMRYQPVSLFLTTNPVLFIFIAILPFILLCPLYYYHQSHPLNLILLGLFTVTLSLTVGITCAFTEGMVVLEALVLTAVVVLSLTAYTFWAARRGYDFSFMGPMLFTAVMILILFGFIQVFFPFGRLSVTIYGGIAALIFSAYIIYDTDNLIKRYSYDEYIWASVALYLDILNLFLALINLFRGIQGR